MNIKKTTVGVAVSALLGLALSGQAYASVYARSYLDIDNLAIVISDDGGTTPGGATVDSFNFQIQDSAQLNNGAVSAFALGCSGTPASNGCGTSPAPTLDIAPANAAGGDGTTRANNNFTFFGPGANQYSNSDAVIYDSQLTSGGANPTDIEQIAEAELQGGFQAASQAEIQSLTGFTFQFTVAGQNQIDILLTSALSILAAINDPLGTAQTAQANVNVEFRLEDDNSTNFALWRPNGILGTGCGAFNEDATTSLACNEIADGYDLNGDAGTSTDGTTDGRTGGGFHRTIITGLYDGDWSLTLNATTSTSLSRQAVPEPGMLGLLGMGLAGMGYMRRRRKSKA